MSIIVDGGLSVNSQTMTVADIIACAKRETQDRFTNSGSGNAILLDYVNRVQRDIIRRRPKGWDWLKSGTQQFITRHGQTAYWVGPSGSEAAGQVDSGLNLTDVFEVLDGTVIDRSGPCPLFKYGEPPAFFAQNPDSTYGINRPYWFRNDRFSPNVLEIMPSPSDEPDYELVPLPPHCTTSVSGALADRFYYVKATFLDEAGGEGLASEATRIFVPASSVLVVKAPQPALTESASGVTYSSYRVYASETEGAETLQSTTTAIGTNWTEPGTGLVAGAALPTDSDLEPLGGWLIQFRYMPALTKLTATSDVLLIPNRYEDVVCAGVTALGAQFNAVDALSAKRAADWSMIYERGVQSMIRDQNPWGPSNFIRPDPSTILSNWM